MLEQTVAMGSCFSTAASGALRYRLKWTVSRTRPDIAITRFWRSCPESGLSVWDCSGLLVFPRSLARLSWDGSGLLVFPRSLARLSWDGSGLSVFPRSLARLSWDGSGLLSLRAKAWASSDPLGPEWKMPMFRAYGGALRPAECLRRYRRAIRAIEAKRLRREALCPRPRWRSWLMAIQVLRRNRALDILDDLIHRSISSDVHLRHGSPGSKWQMQYVSIPLCLATRAKFGVPQELCLQSRSIF